MMLLLRSHTFNKRDFVLRQVRFEQVVLADEVVIAPSIVFLRVRRKVLQHGDHEWVLAVAVFLLRALQPLRGVMTCQIRVLRRVFRRAAETCCHIIMHCVIYEAQIPTLTQTKTDGIAYGRGGC